MVHLQPISLLGGALVSILCIRQIDLKLIIAYSSVGHIRLAICSIALLSKISGTARIIILVAHGISSSAIFAGANFVYLITHSRNLALASGLLRYSPPMAALWFMACMGNMAAPPTFNLMAEVWSIAAIAPHSFALVIGLIGCSFFRVVYSLISYANTSQGQKSASLSSSRPRLHLSVTLLLPHC